MALPYLTPLRDIAWLFAPSIKEAVMSQTRARTEKGIPSSVVHGSARTRTARSSGKVRTPSASIGVCGRNEGSAIAGADAPATSGPASSIWLPSWAERRKGGMRSPATTGLNGADRKHRRHCERSARRSAPQPSDVQSFRPHPFKTVHAASVKTVPACAIDM